MASAEGEGNSHLGQNPKVLRDHEPLAELAAILLIRSSEMLAASRSGVLRVTYGLVANLLGQVLSTFSQILLVPLFLAYWGGQRYGEWLTLSATVAYLSMVDFGMQMFLVNRMNQCYVQGDYREHTRTLHSALLLSLVVSGSALLVGIVCFMLMPIESWFRFSRTSHATAVVVEILLCMQVVGAIPYGLISGCYRSIGEYARGQMVTNIRTVGSLGLTVLALVANGGLAAVAGTQVLVLIATAIWVLRDLRSRHHEISLGLGAADMRLAMSFLVPSSMFFLIQIAMALSVQGSVMMVGALFGAANVAIFVPLRTLANVIRQLSSALHYALWPELTALEASNMYHSLRDIHLMTSKVLVIVSVCTAVFLHFMGSEIIVLWTHRANLFNAQLFDSFLRLLVSQSPWLTGSLVLAASNNHRWLSICYSISAVTGLGLGYVAGQRFGMAGIVDGMWAAECVVCGVWISLTACRMMRERYKRFLTEVLFRGACFSTVFYIIMTWVVSRLPVGPQLARILVFGTTTGAIGITLGYLMCLNRWERARVRTVFTDFRNLRKKAPKQDTDRMFCVSDPVLAETANKEPLPTGKRVN